MKSIPSLTLASRTLAVAVALGAALPAFAQMEAMEQQREASAVQEAVERAREEEARRRVDTILDLRQSLAGRSLDPGFRAATMRSLSSVPLDALREIEGNGARGDLRAALGAATAGRRSGVDGEDDLLLLPVRVGEPQAVSGSAQSGSVFVPVSPCRIVDTRSAPAGAVTPGVVRPFVVSGSDATLFTAQGGNPSGCGIPTGTANAAFVNFVAVGPAGAGDLRAWGYAASNPPPPAASIINFAAVPALNIANGVAVPLCDPLVSTCAYDVLVQADVSATHVVADVLGYFRPPPVSFVARGQTSTSTTFTSACNPYGGAVVSVVAPSAGHVAVRANVQLLVDHTGGVGDFLYVHVGASPTDCSASLGEAAFVTMGPEPTGFYYPTVPVSRLFTVPGPGTYTYYVTGFAASNFNDSFWKAGLLATFHPD